MNSPAGARIYLACGYTDMRKQIDGLAQMVTHNYKLNPFDNAFFLFCGRRCDRIKALYWDGDGFVLLYKRLDGKGAYQWPRSAEAVRELTPQQYRWLMEGLTIDQKKVIAKGSPGRMI